MINTRSRSNAGLLFSKFFSSLSARTIVSSGYVHFVASGSAFGFGFGLKITPPKEPDRTTRPSQGQNHAPLPKITALPRDAIPPHDQNTTHAKSRAQWLS